MAISLHFEDSAARAQVADQPQIPQDSSSDSEDVDETELVPVPRRVFDANPPTGLSILQYIFSLPFTVGYKAVTGLYMLLARLFPRIFGFPAAPAGPPPPPARSAVERFEETYGETGLKLFKGGFSAAFDQARKEFKYLAVVLEGDTAEDEAFNRQVLTDARVVEFLGQQDLLVWLGSMTDEGRAVAQSLRVRQFPTTVLVAPAPRSRTSFAVSMKALAYITGETDPAQFVDALRAQVEKHHPERMALVLDRQEREAERVLRDEQNAAYERSLAADREREKQAQQESARVEKEALTAQAEAEKAALESERLKQAKAALAQTRHEWKLWRAGELARQAAAAAGGAGATEKTARVSIRLLSGHRLIHNFAASQTLEDIYAYVECYDLLGTDPEKTPTAPPQGYTHEYGFQLASAMPRRVVPADATAVSDEKSVWPSGALVVEVDEVSDDE